jgi:hypothetical protein
MASAIAIAVRMPTSAFVPATHRLVRRRKFACRIDCAIGPSALTAVGDLFRDLCMRTLNVRLRGRGVRFPVATVLSAVLELALEVPAVAWSEPNSWEAIMTSLVGLVS